MRDRTQNIQDMEFRVNESIIEGKVIKVAHKKPYHSRPHNKN